MYLVNKYHKCYYAIIANAQARNLTTRKQANSIIGYAEKHHIISKSLSGSNLKDNNVFLIAREHFICHWLLTKFTVGAAKEKMIYALSRMLHKSHNQNRYQTKITARVYEKNRKDKAQLLAGKSPANKGIPLTDEQKAHLSAKMSGRKNGPLSSEIRKKISKSHIGKIMGPQTQEHKEKRAAACRKSIKDDLGNQFESIRAIAAHYNVTTTAIHYRLSIGRYSYA
ncbi:MAG TPA: hypothetical protein VFM18_18575 [Methanosarcina sp.]|nr:hypothetical protein [Methanosarcina sp.]